MAVQNKRVEIVYLKNNTDLSSFLSAVNYSPPAFFSPSVINYQNSYANNNQITQQNECRHSNFNHVLPTHSDCECFCESKVPLNILADNQQRAIQNRVILAQDQSENLHFFGNNQNYSSSINSNASNGLSISDRNHLNPSNLANRMPLFNASHSTNFNSNPIGNHLGASLDCKETNLQSTLANRSISKPTQLFPMDLFANIKSNLDAKEINANIAHSNQRNLGANYNKHNTNQILNDPSRMNQAALSSIDNKLQESYNFSIWENDNNLNESINWNKWNAAKPEPRDSFTSFMSLAASNENNFSLHENLRDLISNKKILKPLYLYSKIDFFFLNSKRP